MYMSDKIADKDSLVFIVIAGSSRNKFIKNIKQIFKEYIIGKIDATWLTNVQPRMNNIKKIQNKDLDKWLVNNDYCRPYIIWGNVKEEYCNLSRIYGDPLHRFIICEIRNHFTLHKNKYSFSKLRVGKIEWGNCYELFQNTFEIIKHSHPYLHAPLQLVETNYLNDLPMKDSK